MPSKGSIYSVLMSTLHAVTMTTMTLHVLLGLNISISWNEPYLQISSACAQLINMNLHPRYPIVKTPTSA